MRLTIVRLLLLAAIASADQADESKIKRSRDKVPGEYIVILEDDIDAEEVSAVADQLTRSHDARLGNVWTDAVKGFTAVMTEARADAMSRKKEVKYIEENSYAYLSAAQQTNIDPRTCDPTTTQQCPTVIDNRLWHLDRADQNYADPTDRYSYCTDGSGITVYVVDTGVNRFHNEFEGTARIRPGYNATGATVPGDEMPADDPCMGFAIAPSGMYETLEQPRYKQEVGELGHGTAVASALGGKRVGIAKNVNIVPIKVFRCDRYSARARRSAQFYLQNETMFRPTATGQTLAVYRAKNSGTTAGTDPYGSSDWPDGDNVEVSDGSSPGGVVWKAIPTAEWLNVSTTAMIIHGLNWILSANNTQGPKSYAIVTMSTWRHPAQAGTPNKLLHLSDVNITAHPQSSRAERRRSPTSGSKSFLMTARLPVSMPRSTSVERTRRIRLLKSRAQPRAHTTLRSRASAKRIGYG